RFCFCAAVGDVVPGGGVAGERGVLGRGARVRYGAGGGIGLGRQDRGKRSVVPVDEAGLRAEVGGEREALELDTAEARVPGLQEQRDLRLAEAVDRLHRVADEEERAAVARLPAGGEALEELPLRVG